MRIMTTRMMMMTMMMIMMIMMVMVVALHWGQRLAQS